MTEIKYAEGTTYLVVQGKEGYGKHWILQGFRCLKTKPDVARDEIALRLKLKLPAALFEKPLLAANISIDGEVPTMDLTAETINTVEDLIRAQTGLDVELTVVSPDV